MHKVYRWIDVYVCVDVWFYMLYIDVCGHVCICLCFLLFICIEKMCVLKRIHKVQDNFFGYGYIWIFASFVWRAYYLFFYECECRCLCWFVWVLHVSVSCECFVWILCLYCHQKRERDWCNQPRYVCRPKQDRSCLEFWSAKDTTLTTHRTLSHSCSGPSTEIIYSYSDRHIRSNNHELFHAWSAMHIITDPTAISGKAFEVRSLCVHSVLWATNPHPSKCLNALLSLSRYGNPKPRGPQFQQHSETLDSDQ